MPTQTRAKQERIIEAVRQNLEGDAAVEFVCRSGYAMTSAGIVRNLRLMGGRGRIQDLIEAGHPNVEILHICFPDDEPEEHLLHPPLQPDLFESRTHTVSERSSDDDDVPLYETTKLSLRIPAELFEAIRLAARAEHKTQTQLVIDILTSALARMPEPPRD